MSDAPRPLSRYALRDSLNNDQEAIRLVRDMLKATTHYAGHDGGFRADANWNGQTRTGYTYFLGSSGTPTDPSFENHRILQKDIRPALRALGFIVPSQMPNIVGGFWQFTPTALEWYRNHDGPSDDEVRKGIGRIIADNAPTFAFATYPTEELASEIGISSERVTREVYALIHAGLLEHHPSERDKLGPLRLSIPLGVRWAAADFPPIVEFGSVLLHAAEPLRKRPGAQSMTDVPAALDPSAPVTAFIAYAHKDKRYLDQLHEHLAQLRNQGKLDAWHDRRIDPGQEWEGEIDSRLFNDRLILLLVSPSFMASDYCYKKEMTTAMERHEAGQATVIPIIVRPCDWESAPFGKLEALPDKAKSITRWSPQDSGWLNVTKGIRRVVDGLIKTASAPPSVPIVRFGGSNQPTPLGKDDETVLKAAVRHALQSQEPLHAATSMTTNDLASADTLAALDQQALVASVRALVRHGLAKIGSDQGAAGMHFTITPEGMQYGIPQVVPNIDEQVGILRRAICDVRETTAAELSHTGISPRLVEQIALDLERQKLLETRSYMEGTMFIEHVSSELCPSARQERTEPAASLQVSLRQEPGRLLRSGRPRMKELLVITNTGPAFAHDVALGTFIPKSPHVNAPGVDRDVFPVGEMGPGSSVSCAVQLFGSAFEAEVTWTDSHGPQRQMFTLTRG